MAVAGFDTCTGDDGLEFDESFEREGARYV